MLNKICLGFIAVGFSCNAMQNTPFERLERAKLPKVNSDEEIIVNADWESLKKIPLPACVVTDTSVFYDLKKYATRVTAPVIMQVGPTEVVSLDNTNILIEQLKQSLQRLVRVGNIREYYFATGKDLYTGSDQSALNGIKFAGDWFLNKLPHSYASNSS